MIRPLHLPLLPTLLLAAFCGSLEAAPLKVAATFTIPADIARGVAGEGAQVRSLMPANADFHVIQPTPAQVRILSDADVVVAIHPLLETWIADLEAAGTIKHPVVYLGAEILKDGVAGCDEHGTPGHTHPHAENTTAENDPHVWMNPELAGVMAQKLAESLARLAPGKAAEYRAAGAAYVERMRVLSASIEKTLEEIPDNRRVLVSQHDNLRRFARKYRFEVPGTLLDSASTEAADPSAKRMAKLIGLIRTRGVPAVFADNTLSHDLPEAVAREAALPPPVTLMIDALDKPGTPGATYEGMMLENARRIAGALKPVGAPAASGPAR